MKKILAVQAEVGACKNIVKNMLLLNQQCHFPDSTVSTIEDRAQWLINNVYPLDMTDEWFAYEFRTKDYEQYGMSFDSDGGDITAPGMINLSSKLSNLLQEKNYVCDVHHLHTAQQLLDVPHVHMISVVPQTDLGLHWQVRAIVTKNSDKGIWNCLVPDNSIVDMVQEKFGMDHWNTANLICFREQIYDNLHWSVINGVPTLPLEWVIDPDKWNNMLDWLENQYNLTLPHDQCKLVLNQWYKHHWHIDDTYNWPHAYTDPKFRTQEHYGILAQYAPYQYYNE